MRRTLAVVCLIVTTSLAAQPDPTTLPAVTPHVVLTEEVLDRAISRAVDYLWAAQHDDGSWAAKGESADVQTPLVMHALLTAWESPESDQALKALKWLGTRQTQDTRALALRCLVWEEVARRSLRTFRSELRSGGRQIFKGITAGAMGHTIWTTQAFHALNDADVELPRGLYREAMGHFCKTQNADGGWGDGPGKPSNIAMTAAGVCAVQFCHLKLTTADFVEVGKDPSCESVERGLRWLDTNIGDLLAGGRHTRPDLPRCLYSIQQTARTTGRWRFGEQNLLTAGAVALLRSQKVDGSWSGPSPVTATAYAVAFLSRARQPILLAHLQYDGAWSNRPGASAGLADWARRRTRPPFSGGWQVWDVRTPVRDWADARVLLITGSKAPKFTAEQIEKLRLYVQRGGMIFSCTEGGSEGFAKGIREVYRRLFPEYELTACRPDHPIYSRDFAHFPRKDGQPPFSIISNGVRPLIIHTDVDLPKAWQLSLHRTQRAAFEGALNVVLYVNGFMMGFPTPGCASWPKEATSHPKRTVKLTRVRHGGNWDPEPLAYERFSRLMGMEASVRVELLEPMAAGKLADCGAPIAVLTGAGKLALSEGKRAGLKKFVAGGGTLLIDAAGGNAKFAASARAILGEMYGPGALVRLPTSSAIYARPGMEIERVQYRLRTLLRVRTVEPQLQAVLVGRRPGVLFSAEDLTAGLLGCRHRTATTPDPPSSSSATSSSTPPTPAGSDGGRRQGRKNCCMRLRPPAPRCGPGRSNVQRLGGAAEVFEFALGGLELLYGGAEEDLGPLHFYLGGHVLLVERLHTVQVQLGQFGLGPQVDHLPFRLAQKHTQLHGRGSSRRGHCGRRAYRAHRFVSVHRGRCGHRACRAHRFVSVHRGRCGHRAYPPRFRFVSVRRVHCGRRVCRRRRVLWPRRAPNGRLCPRRALPPRRTWRVFGPPGLVRLQELTGLLNKLPLGPFGQGLALGKVPFGLGQGLPGGLARLMHPPDFLQATFGLFAGLMRCPHHLLGVLQPHASFSLALEAALTSFLDLGFGELHPLDGGGQT